MVRKAGWPLLPDPPVRGRKPNHSGAAHHEQTPPCPHHPFPLFRPFSPVPYQEQSYIPFLFPVPASGLHILPIIRQNQSHRCQLCSKNRLFHKTHSLLTIPFYFIILPFPEPVLRFPYNLSHPEIPFALHSFRLSCTMSKAPCCRHSTELFY